MFAHDAKIMKAMESHRDCKILQRHKEYAAVVRQLAKKFKPGKCSHEDTKGIKQTRQ